MSDLHDITDIQLNALIDNELDDNDKAEILNRIAEDPQLTNKVSEIRQDMDLISLAYGNLDIKDSLKQNLAIDAGAPWHYVAVAATLFLLIGLTADWLSSIYNVPATNPSFAQIKDYDPATSTADKIMIHINSMDIGKVDSAFTKLEQTLQASNESRDPVQIKFIVNVEGIAVLRQGSPYTDKIRLLTDQYDNVEFLACGIAMETTRLKEQKEVKLLPEVRKVPAALTEILESLEAGWLYMRS